MHHVLKFLFHYLFIRIKILLGGFINIYVTYKHLYGRQQTFFCEIRVVTQMETPLTILTS